MTLSPRRLADDGDGGFEAFLHANNATLRRFIQATVVNPADVDDIHQKTWISLADYWDKFGAPCSDEHAHALMFQTAKLRTIDHMRAKSRQPEGLPWDPDQHDQVDPNSCDPFDAVLHFLASPDTRPKLTHRQQAALRLVYLEGHSQQAAAALLGISVNALERLLQRARKTIAQARRATETSTEEGSR